VARFPALDTKLLVSRALVGSVAKSVKITAPFVEWLVFATA